VYLAEIHRDAGRRERAEALYRRALRIAPGDVSALVGLGALVFERGDHAGAIRLWKDAEARNPGLVLARTNLAMAQWRSGDRDGARATLKQVMELSPAFQPAADLLRQLSR
jgi:tetratricopeptide (TPR) repeat protein